MVELLFLFTFLSNASVAHMAVYFYALGYATALYMFGLSCLLQC